MGAFKSTFEQLHFTDLTSDATPSFALLDVQGPVIVTYVYQLVDGEVCPDPPLCIHSTHYLAPSPRP